MSTAILAIAIVAYIKLLDWNRGKEMAQLINLLKKGSTTP